VRSTLGPIRGFIHAAGVVQDSLILDKTWEQFDDVFDTKVVGLRNCLDAMEAGGASASDSLSSVSARLAVAGKLTMRWPMSSSTKSRTASPHDYGFAAFAR